MKISYDAEVDALYIRLLEGRHECRCVRLSDEVALNIGAGKSGPHSLDHETQKLS